MPAATFHLCVEKFHMVKMWGVGGLASALHLNAPPSLFSFFRSLSPSLPPCVNRRLTALDDEVSVRASTPPPRHRG